MSSVFEKGLRPLVSMSQFTCGYRILFQNPIAVQVILIERGVLYFFSNSNFVSRLSSR